MGIITSVVTAGKSRLRPVLMTTLTTVLGMIPMAVGTGEGSEMWRSMGTVSYTHLMALLVKEQTKMLRPSNVFCKHSITEVYNTILLTFLKGISTEKGRAILDRFDLKQSYDL